MHSSNKSQGAGVDHNLKGGCSFRRPPGRLGIALACVMAGAAMLVVSQSALAGGGEVSSVQDGNWNDPNTWDIRVPDASLGDQVYIVHNVSANGVGQNATDVNVGWLAGSGSLSMSSGELNLDRNLSVGSFGNQGSVSVSGGTVQTESLYIGEGLMTVSGGHLSVAQEITVGSSTSSGRLVIVGHAATLGLLGGDASAPNLRIRTNGTLAIVPTADGAAGLSAIDCSQEEVVLDAAATLELDTSSYSPSLNDSWTVITDAKSITGSFGSLVAPPGFVLQQDFEVPGELTIRVTETPCDELGGDSDHDGVCDNFDICPGYDDAADVDTDGIPDGCDTCADANVYNVTQDTFHPTIADAITSSSSGDVIELGACVFVERDLVLADHDLTLRGQGADATIIDGDGMDGRILSIRNGSNGTIDDITFRNGFSSAPGGGAALGVRANSVALIRRCRFEGNEADGAVGAVQLDGGSTSTFQECTFTGNSSDSQASTVFLFNSATSARFVNTLFYANTGTASSVIRTQLGTMEFVNCTFAETLNQQSTLQQVVRNSISIQNCVHDATSVPDSDVSASRCLFPGASGDNISGAPTFVDALNGDFRLAPGSLGIDAADHDAYVAATGGSVDLNGDTRTQDDTGTIDSGLGVLTYLDMGAFEFHGTTYADCNSNGTNDAQDIESGTSTDCNMNGVPDDCELADNDCNSNGTPDECESDYNVNGVPDACDDCNTNGFPDGLDIAAGTSQDCNTNGVPDECDVTLQTVAHLAAPAPLNSNAAVDSAFDFQPQLTTDGAGNWIAVWIAGDGSPELRGTENAILYSRSTDSGVNWTAPAPLVATAGFVEVCQLTTDGAGHWIAVWDSSDDLGGTIGTDGDILYSRSTDNGANWTAPAPLNTNAGTDDNYDADPQLTADRAGHWLAVWRTVNGLGGPLGTDDDILYSSSTDNGATWSDSAPLNTTAATDTANDYAPQLTTDGAGRWIAVWESRDSSGGPLGTDEDILYSSSTDDGANWTAPAPLNTTAATDTADDNAPQLTTDGAGHWIAVWQSRDNPGGPLGTDEDILYSRSMDNGATWSAPAPLNTSAATDTSYDGNPQLTTDGAGEWIAVWDSYDNFGGPTGDDNDILYSRSAGNGEIWSAPAPLNANASTDTGYDGEPQLTTDGAGQWIAVWGSDDDLGGTIGTDADILLARLTFEPWSLDQNHNDIPDECESACSFGGDFDDDGDVDLTDYSSFAACQGGPAESAAGICVCFDLDDDGDVDLRDFAEFQVNFTGN